MATPKTGRPRGRPPGSKNLPKTIEGLVAATFSDPIVIPPRKAKGKPRGPWAGMTPEERKAYSAKMRAKQVIKAGGRKPGVPYALTADQHQRLLEQELPKIDRMISKMAETGAIPDDALAQEALRELATVMRTQTDAKIKLAAIRTALDFTKAKPSQKIEHTVKTAEDFLDEMAED